MREKLLLAVLLVTRVSANDHSLNEAISGIQNEDEPRSEELKVEAIRNQEAEFIPKFSRPTFYRADDQDVSFSRNSVESNPNPLLVSNEILRYYGAAETYAAKDDVTPLRASVEALPYQSAINEVDSGSSK